MSKAGDQQSADMEVDLSAAAAEEKPVVRFSINGEQPSPHLVWRSGPVARFLDRSCLSLAVLELMREAQMQHGLRQSDYTRYRRYCSARLRRLYKSLKFLHGRGKYTRRNITESTVTDVRCGTFC
nr:unnamed protein product [Digitaria exilis]